MTWNIIFNIMFGNVVSDFVDRPIQTKKRSSKTMFSNFSARKALAKIILRFFDVYIRLQKHLHHRVKRVKVTA